MVHGQKYNRSRRTRLLDADSGLESVDVRHRDVENEHIGLQARRGTDRFATIVDGGDDGELAGDECRDPISIG